MLTSLLSLASSVLLSSGCAVSMSAATTTTASTQTNTVMHSSVTVTDRWQDMVPREPMWLVNTFSGIRNATKDPEGNARGYARWYRGPNAVENLVDRIRDGYGHGARWFFVNRPMGTAGGSHVPASSWLTLDEERRSEIPALLTDALLDEFDEPVHVIWFIGSQMRDPRDIQGWSEQTDRSHYMLGETNSWDRVVGTRATLGGWISTGASGLGIDHSANPGEREHFITLFEQLRQPPFGMIVMGEAFPLRHLSNRVVRDGKGNPELDQGAMMSMPWIASDKYVVDRWPDMFDSDQFPLNEADTRMFVWILQGEGGDATAVERVAYVGEFLDMGLIPITNCPVMFGEAQARLGTGLGSSSFGASAGGSDSGSGGSGSGSDTGSGSGSESSTASSDTEEDQTAAQRRAHYLLRSSRSRSTSSVKDDEKSSRAYVRVYRRGGVED